MGKEASFFEKWKYPLILVGIFIFGFILRIYNLHDNIIFAYDQARDAGRILGIITLHGLKLVGPETDIPGVFNGPLFYYLLAPIYYFGHLDPNFVSGFVALINSLTIFLIYYATNLMFKNKSISVLAAFLWTISFAQSNFSRFISNASFMGPSSLIFFTGLILYFLKKKNIGLPISILGLALSVQFNFYLIYLGIFYIVLYFLFQRKHSIKFIVYNLILAIFLFSPFIVSEIRFHFIMVKAFVSYFNQQSIPVIVTDDISRFIQQFSTGIYYSFFSFSLFLGLFLVVLFLIYLHRNVKFTGDETKSSLIFLDLWLFSTLPLFAFGSGVLAGQVVNSTILPAMTIAFALAIYLFFVSDKYKVFGILALVLVLFSNLKLFHSTSFTDYSIFDLQALTLKDEKSLIDYTYSQSKGQPFSICAVTNPLFVNTLWGYLYYWYGNSRYHYLPYWAGQKQYLAESLLPYDTNHTQLRFLIIEPQGGVPNASLRSFIYMEDKTSDLIQTKYFGAITLEERKLNVGKKLQDTQDLSPAQLINILDVIKKDARYSCYNSY